VWFDGRRSTFDERGGGSDPSFSEMPDGLAPPGPGSCEESLMPTTGRTQTPRVHLGWKPAASGSDPSGRLSAQLPVDDSKRMRLHRIACFVASRLKARSRDKRLAGPFVQWAVADADPVSEAGAAAWSLGQLRARTSPRNYRPSVNARFAWKAAVRSQDIREYGIGG
jgi:hypothetical protein